MATMITRPGFITEEHLTFLDELRESGITNMFGATPFILDRFWRLTAPQAREILTYWMKTFTIRRQAIRESGRDSHEPVIHQESTE